MKKTKVLLIGMTSGVGGVETFMTDLNSMIDHTTMETCFLVHQNINERYLSEINKAGSEVFCVTGIKNNPFKFFRDMFKLFRENDFDVVHLNECGASFFIYAFPVIFNKKIKFIVHSHNGSSRSVFSHRLFSLIQNNRADEQWACSEVAAEWMFGKKRIKKYGVKIIHNGIDIDKYKFSLTARKKIRRELNINDNQVVIGSVARFEEQKNHIKIIDIFEAYYKNHHDSVLCLVGEGSLLEKIQNLVEEKGLTQNVKFLGLRNDINEMLMAFDVLLLPSLYEGLPFIGIEAQATGLPVLMSDTVSNQLKITDLVYIERLENGSEEWADKLEKIISVQNDRNSKLYSDSLRASGYDMREVAKNVMEYYSK